MQRDRRDPVRAGAAGERQRHAGAGQGQGKGQELTAGAAPPSLTEAGDKLKQLRATTQFFKKAAAGLTGAQLYLAPEPGEWSVNELLGHLRGCADVQGGWIAKILSANTPSIRYASPRTGMRNGKYGEVDWEENLAAFTRQRSDLVKTLSALTLADWSRHATFTGTKPGWVQTVFDVASGLAGHEHHHFDQIAATASAVKGR